MRRVNYAANKERINAQKRAAYAARRLREQANRGILDDIMGGYLLVTEQSIEAVQPFTCRVLDEAGQQALARASFCRQPPPTRWEPKWLAAMGWICSP